MPQHDRRAPSRTHERAEAVDEAQPGARAWSVVGRPRGASLPRPSLTLTPLPDPRPTLRGEPRCSAVRAAGRLTILDPRVKSRSTAVGFAGGGRASGGLVAMPTPSEEAARRRTFAIISHPDAGKTTLTEKFLLYGGALAARPAR